MKNKYSDLMYCGYSIYSPTYFFNELALVHEHIEKHPNERVRVVMSDFYKFLVTRVEEVTFFLKFPAPKLLSLGINIPNIHEAPMPKHYFPWITAVEEVISNAIPDKMSVEFISYSFGKYVSQLSSCLHLIRHATNITADTQRALDLSDDIAKIMVLMHTDIEVLTSLSFFLTEASGSDVFSTTKEGFLAVSETLKQYQPATCSEIELRQMGGISIAFFETMQASFGECLEAIGRVG